MQAALAGVSRHDLRGLDLHEAAWIAVAAFDRLGLKAVVIP
jgi:hypothetical protein